MVIGIHHAQITIEPGGEEQARFFYGTLLQLPEVEKPENLRARGGMWFDIGTQQLHVGIQSESHRANSRAHIAYQVEVLAPVIERLEEHGFTIKRGVMVGTFERVECRDPYCNRVELLADTVSGG